MAEQFDLKSSGERATFSSGMQRDVDTDKVRFDLILPTSQPGEETMFHRWAVLLTKGAKKYSARNWEKAEGDEELQRFKESAFRHFMQWYTGQRDEDHAAAVFFNITGAEYVKGKLATKLTRIPYRIDPSLWSILDLPEPQEEQAVMTPKDYRRE